MTALLAAALLAAPPALTAEQQQQILSAFAPGDAPAGLQVLGSIADGKATVVFACGTGAKARPLVARFEGGALRGDPVEVGEPLASCGAIALSQPFTIRAPGQPARSAVVATWNDAGKALLTAAVTLEPRVLAWTTAEPPAGGQAIVPLARGRAAAAALCVRQADGAWDTVSWQEAAGAWESGAGPCKPPQRK
jgi:hypothetical protein